MNEIKQIALKDITAQKHFTDDDPNIAALAESITANGLLKPLLLEEKDGHYHLLSGESRFAALKLLKKETAPAIVGSADSLFDLTLLENSRNRLNAIEEAKAIRRLMQEKELTQEEVARILKLKQSTVANKLRLLRLPDYIQKAVETRKITERHARALLKVEEKDLAKTFAVITERQYNVKRSEEYIKDLYRQDKLKIRGVSSNVRLGINTIKESFALCKRSGLDAEYQLTEYQNEVKITIRFKKQ